MNQPFATRRNAISGMAHFAGSGPVDKKCSDCRHWKYVHENWTKTALYSGCAKYHELMRKHGPEISGQNEACKYFEQE